MLGRDLPTTGCDVSAPKLDRHQKLTSLHEFSLLMKKFTTMRKHGCAVCNRNVVENSADTAEVKD